MFVSPNSSNTKTQNISTCVTSELSYVVTLSFLEGYLPAFCKSWHYYLLVQLMGQQLMEITGTGTVRKTTVF
jgi:hypothetical protein